MIPTVEPGVESLQPIISKGKELPLPPGVPQPESCPLPPDGPELMGDIAPEFTDAEIREMQREARRERRRRS